MSLNEEFKRVYERANYAKVEDNISALEQSLEGDSRDIGYGIARNVAAFGSSADVERLEDEVRDVSRELKAVSDGVQDYRISLSKSRPASLQGGINYHDMTKGGRGFPGYTQKTVRY